MTESNSSSRKKKNHQTGDVRALIFTGFSIVIILIVIISYYSKQSLDTIATSLDKTVATHIPIIDKIRNIDNLQFNRTLAIEKAFRIASNSNHYNDKEYKNLISTVNSISSSYSVDIWEELGKFEQFIKGTLDSGLSDFDILKETLISGNYSGVKKTKILLDMVLAQIYMIELQCPVFYNH